MAGRGTDIKLAEGVAELGGLQVIGATRHDSRRIDVSLEDVVPVRVIREVQFSISQLEDNLVRLFGSRRIIMSLRDWAWKRVKSLKVVCSQR